MKALKRLWTLSLDLVMLLMLLAAAGQPPPKPAAPLPRPALPYLRHDTAINPQG